jgi:hypothetical protein
MAIQDAANGVGNRLIRVVALDQDGKKPGDVAAPSGTAGTGALQKARQFGKHARRPAAGGRRLPGGKADFAQGEAIAR